MASNYPEPPSHMPMHSQGARDTSPGVRPAFSLGSHPAGTSTEPDDPQADLKRPRACEPCRQLKVRCDPDPTNPEGSCKRCAKAGRTCIVTAPTRKRQKKTDSRVTELERKIDALTATLQASHSNAFGMGPPGQQHSPAHPPHPEEQPASRGWLRDDPNLAGSKRHHDGLLVSQYPRLDSSSTEQIHKTASSKWRGPYAGETAPPKAEAANEFADVIDKGIVDHDSAHAAFDRYVHHMADEMPMVVFPPGTTMSDVRRDKPALFLAIMAIAIGPFNKNAQPTVLSEVYHVVADRVVVKGEKSLELVQALLVLTIWYQPPDNLEELKFYQLIHLAVVLGMDIGLNRRSPGDPKPFARLREALIKKPLGASADLNGPEARRTWVGCYFLSVQVATALRRTHLVRWQPYMDDCLHVLETHPEALPSDRRVVWWAKLGLIMEEAGMQLLTDDPESIISFADSKTRYTIRAFANQLAQWRKDVPEEFYTMPLAHTHHVINLFVHESAMSVDCRNSSIPPSPSNDDLCTSLIAPLIDALTTCIHSIHQSLDAVTSVDSERLICLPTVALARTSYPVVSLIKIYSLLTASETRIGQVIDIQSLRIDYYLDKVINHYRTAAALDGGRAPAKFGNIIMMLRNWFVKKKENGPALREMFGTEMRTDTPSDKQPIKQGTTPLDLLSEVATGNPTPRAPSTGPLSHQSRPGQEHIYPPSIIHPSLRPTPTPTPGPSTYRPTDPPNPLDRPTTKSSPAPPPPPTTTWSSTPTFSPSINGNQDPNMSTRAYYQPFITPDPSQGYGATQGNGTYPDMSSMGMSLAQPMGMVPELGMEATFDPDNLFALGTMMDEGLFTFPLTFDGGFQF